MLEKKLSSRSQPLALWSNRSIAFFFTPAGSIFPFWKDEKLRGWRRDYRLKSERNQRENERSGGEPWEKLGGRHDALLLDVCFFELIDALEGFSKFICVFDAEIFAMGDFGDFF